MMRKEALKLFLIGSGTIAWSLTMIKSGLQYSFGLGFWGANGHDGVWHIALINSLAKGSLQMPVFSGFDIKNYHLGFDLLIALMSKATNISAAFLYFQVIPPLLAFFVGLCAYMFIFEWTKSRKSALLGAFFIYFGGDMSWIFGKGESTFWSQQSISTLINPPFALSLIFIFIGLYFLMRKQTILSILFFGILLETKAYAGVLVLGSLLLVGIWQVLKEKKAEYLKIFLGSVFISLVLYLLLNRSSENPFIFSPFWFLQTLFNLDRFSIPRLASAIANYNLAHNWIKLAPALGVAFIIFLVGNMWTRVLAVFTYRKIDKIKIIITLIILGGIFIPTFFVQKGTPWNTIQFFYYSLMFSGVLAGIALKNAKSIIFIIVILLTIPTTIITLKDVYLPQRPPSKISDEELSALIFLAKEPQGIVLTYPFDEESALKAQDNPPQPLYLYTSTAYVSAYSSHQVFLEDQINLDITGFDWGARRNEVFNFINTLNQNSARDFLKENNIKYVYWLKTTTYNSEQRARLGETQLGITKIFENKEVNIFKVE